MRIYEETQETKTVVKRRELSCLCDWCRKEIPYEVYYDVDTDIRWTAGGNYPDGGSYAGWTIEDLCEECAEKLKIALIAMGIVVKRVEGDW